ncbi:DNA-dependent metalloprotease SPRTN [Lycorma delicatula]|uniref:DNA-dependent metalloprotease SPRTN n=1 Tax=Lycorma delicatula TaxID=130591 RepID=UPI003F519F87
MADDSDFLLALHLQSEFDNEDVLSNRASKNTSKRKSPILINDNGCLSQKKHKPESLIDPEWEVIDPTPDIRGLFMTFNKRFFWNALGSVEVRWSPRMYSCAGVCSYEGRSGLCSVRLSEPLLKLRPRKDLVETLLHEMIHAYLFVTQNDRDRDGHGPEFKKHMHRINNLAGTNITIYHSFHNEVKVYQKHWWRCNGPCNNRPPFFGMIKRSMNRAPGPNDFWWLNHETSCGGQFIKVRGPEPKINKSKSNQSILMKSPGKSDIRNYFNNNQNSKQTNIVYNVQDIKKTYGATNKTIDTLSNASVNVKGSLHSSKGSSAKRNISFNDLLKENNNSNRPSNTGNYSKKTSVSKGEDKKLGNHGVVKKNTQNNKNFRSSGNALMNKSTGTFTITSKYSGNNNSDTVKKPATETFVPFSGSGNRLGSVSESCSNSMPVSSLLSLYPASNASTSNSCSNSNNKSKTSSEFSPEKYRDDFLDKTLSDDELADIEFGDVIICSTPNEKGDFVKCPVCNIKINRDDMSIHLQSCDILNSTIENMSTCSTLDISDDEDDGNIKEIHNGRGFSSQENNTPTLPCPCCSKYIVESGINKHLDECLSLLAIKEFDEKDW